MKDAAMTGAQAAASDTHEAVPAAAWRMLGLAVAAQAAWSLLVSTPAYLIPLLHLQRGLPLAKAGLLAAAPFTLSTFGMIWLITALGWSAAAAGAVIAVSQFVGAFGRIFVGYLSDRVGSRMRVLRWVAVSGVAVMLALAAAGALHWAAASAIVLVIASTVSVADNGLSFTSVAEAAGRAWSGRALGVQNTGQFIAASVVGPGLGALIAAVGFPVSFALVALTPLAAVPLVPPRDRHRA